MRLMMKKRVRIATFIEIVVVAFVALNLLDLISFLRSHRYEAQVVTDNGFLEELDLFPQAIAHLIHAIKLREIGVTPYDGGYISLIGTILIQIIPSRILSAFDLELYNGPWLLAEYVKHAGGFFVPAELYFIGGIESVAYITFYLGVLAQINNYINQWARMRGNSALTIVVLVASASNIYGMYYGVQALHRMISLPIVFFMISLLVETIRNKQTKQRDGLRDVSFKRRLSRGT